MKPAAFPQTVHLARRRQCQLQGLGETRPGVERTENFTVERQTYQYRNRRTDHQATGWYLSYCACYLLLSGAVACLGKASELNSKTTSHVRWKTTSLLVALVLVRRFSLIRACEITAL